MLKILGKLGNLDRRWLYLAVVLALIVPLVFPVPIPRGEMISPPTRSMFDLLESCPPDKVVWVDSSWDSGSASENRLEYETVIRHLCRKKIKFVVTSIGITPQGPEFADRYAARITEAAGYQYGVDWVNLGYVAGPPTLSRGALGIIIERCGRDVHAAFPTDWASRRLSELPLMARVRTYADVHAFGVITYQANEDWMSVVSGVFRGKLWVGCMSIAAPAFYPYLQSGQMAGMLAGMRGTAEYEALLGERGAATGCTMAGAFGNCVVILAAIVGNIGWWAQRRLRREARA
jgi:hypothetical protein